MINKPIKYFCWLRKHTRKSPSQNKVDTLNKKEVSYLRSKNKYFKNIFTFLRQAFENKKLQKFLGYNLTIIFLSSSLYQPPQKGSIFLEENLNVKSPLVLETQTSIQYPVENIKINQGFSRYHQGIDLDGNIGDKVRPIAQGVVVAVRYSNIGYGNAILISHDKGVTSLYAHLSKINVSTNQEVTKQTVIGEIGSSGKSTGPHLHLEIRENKVTINPIYVLGR